MNHKKFIRLATCAAMLLASTISYAKIVLPSVIGNNMVVQQNTKIRLWGKATPGATISVSASWTDGKQEKTVADAAGCWRLEYPTLSASLTPHNIVIEEKIGMGRQPRDVVELDNILIGEVWLASGQSNMEMPLKGFGGCCVKDGAKDAMNAHNEAPYVRMFNVRKSQNLTPQSDCEGQWNTTEFKNAMEFSATAYYFASSLSNALGIPVGIVNSSYGGAHVESWTSREVCRQYPDIPQDSVGIYNFGDWDFDRPMLMYNAMFCPVKDYTYKGIIWYQGCSNIRHANEYPERLKNMVDLWRKDIGLGDIPFYQVQIAPYIFDKTENDTVGARLREAQDKACGIISNCDIVCTNDLVLPIERYNIHPSQKRTVGLRLALMALNKTYGMKEIAYCGPRFDREKFHVDGSTAIVGFTTNEFGICRNWGLEGFEIAGEDRVFHAATAEFHWQTNEVFLTSPNVPKPVAVRYCFKDFQIGNLIGGNELPCFPFRTDEW